MYKSNKLQTYKKKDLDAIDDLGDFHSLIKDFDHSSVERLSVVEKHTLVLLVGDDKCKASLKAKQEFEEVLIQNSDTHFDSLENQFSFQFASIMRAELDHLVPNELPLLLYIKPQELGKKRIGAYFWSKIVFDRMLEYVYEGMDIYTSEEFLDINNFQMEIGGEL